MKSYFSIIIFGIIFAACGVDKNSQPGNAEPNIAKFAKDMGLEGAYSFATEQVDMTEQDYVEMSNDNVGKLSIDGNKMQVVIYPDSPSKTVYDFKITKLSATEIKAIFLGSNIPEVGLSQSQQEAINSATQKYESLKYVVKNKILKLTDKKSKNEIWVKK